MEHSPSSHHHSPNEVKTLLSWMAPGRPFRKKGKDFYISSLMVVFLIEVILFIFSQYLLMFVVLTLYFFSIALALTPPQNFHYKISTQGIKVDDHFYIWDELYDFYFKVYDGVTVLVVRTHDMIPGELKISLGDVSMDHLRSVLVEFLPYREVVRQTFMEKSAEWLSRNFPLER